MRARRSSASARAGGQPARETRAEIAELAEHLAAVRDRLLGGRGRRRRAEVGDEVGERDVGLVADGGDGRHSHRGERAADRLGVERREVFPAPAAAPDDAELHVGDSVHQPKRAATRACGRAVALDPGVHHDEPASRATGCAPR